MRGKAVPLGLPTHLAREGLVLEMTLCRQSLAPLLGKEGADSPNETHQKESRCTLRLPALEAERRRPVARLVGAFLNLV